MRPSVRAMPVSRGQALLAALRVRRERLQRAIRVRTVGPEHSLTLQQARTVPPAQQANTQLQQLQPRAPAVWRTPTPQTGALQSRTVRAMSATLEQTARRARRVSRARTSPRTVPGAARYAPKERIRQRPAKLQGQLARLALSPRGPRPAATTSRIVFARPDTRLRVGKGAVPARLARSRTSTGPRLAPCVRKANTAPGRQKRPIRRAAPVRSRTPTPELGAAPSQTALATSGTQAPTEALARLAWRASTRT